MFQKLAAGMMILLILAVVFAMASVVAVADAAGAEGAATYNGRIDKTMRHNTLPSGVTMAVRSNPTWIVLPPHVVSRITDGNLHCALAVNQQLFKSAHNRATIMAALDTKNLLGDQALWLYINSQEEYPVSPRAMPR